MTARTDPGEQSQQSRAATGGRWPIAALRARLDAGSANSRWLVDPDGVRGRVLELGVGARYAVPVALPGEATFSARTMLFPHDWRDREGALRASVTAVGASGTRRELWAGVLEASDRGRPGGHDVDVALTADTRLVELAVGRHGDPGSNAVMRAIWVDPVLVDPHGSEPPPPAQAAAPPGEAPLISVLTPVHDPPPHMLDDAIASVQVQTYPRWELQLIDDGSQDPAVIAALKRHAAADPRIHLHRRDTAGGISTATNTALQHATGDYIALLDHDDTLAPDALQHIADTIAAQPDLDMIYTDEDILENGDQALVHLKPDWSPDTLRTNGYTCHLGVYRRALVDDLGGFRSAFDGSQDVDMILRLTERTDRIAHVPRILYHWRAHPTSTAGGDAKPYAYVAARNAIAAHLERTGLDATVGYGPPGLYRVAHRVDPATTVDIIVPAGEHLDEAIATWRAQPHAAWRVIHDPTDATAEHLLFMDTPLAGLTHDWLTRLIGYSQQPGIAAAGPVILNPDGRIQHAGIALPNGTPLYLLHGARSSMDHHFGYGTSVFNVTALSGALITPRATYERLGGLDAAFGDLALIEYCLRATDAGERAVIVPDARLRTLGPDPATNDLPALAALRLRWAQSHTGDRYYNPNYRTDRGDFAR